MNKTPNAEEIRETLIANGFELTSENLMQIQKLMKQKKADEVKKHREVRKENREKTQSQKERDYRTHKLCTLAGTFEKYFPNIIELYPNEMDDLVFELSNSPVPRIIINRHIDKSCFAQNQRILKKEGGESDG